MYDNRIRVAVSLHTADGSPLPDKRRDSVIPIPFGTEYFIRIQGRNSIRQRALVHICIDGECVTDNGLIVNLSSRSDIKRPVDRDSSFCFVDINSLAAYIADKDIERPDGATGLIEVRVHLEKEPVRYQSIFNHNPLSRKRGFPHNPYAPHYHNPLVGGMASSLSDCMNSRASNADSMNFVSTCGCDMGSKKFMEPPLETGVTVDGAETGQNYGLGHIVAEEEFSLFTFKLLGYDPNALNSNVILQPSWEKPVVNVTSSISALESEVNALRQKVAMKKLQQEAEEKKQQLEKERERLLQELEN